MTDFWNEFCEISEARMSEATLTLREKMLINHIKQLQKTIDTLSCDLHDDLYLLAEQMLKTSREIIKIAEGGAP